MEHRTTYACGACGAQSAVTILEAGPADPLAEERSAAWEARAQRVLRYATCPRCKARNPAGVAEQARENRTARILLFPAVIFVGVATYFFPWLAWVIVGIDLLLVVLNSFLWLRKDQAERKVSSLLMSVGTFAVLIAFAVLQPRWIGLVGVGALRGVGGRVNVDRIWTMAAEKFRFDPAI